MKTADEAACNNSIKKFFLRGGYREERFRDAEGDVPLFVRAKLPELMRFLRRKKKLQGESLTGSAGELAPDRERTLPGKTTPGQRRTQLKAIRDLKLNRAGLRKSRICTDLP